MHIGFDAKKIVANLTGIGNYSRGIVNALATAYPENEYTLFAPCKGNEQCTSRLSKTNSITFCHPPYQSSLQQEWWRCKGIVRDIKRQRVDLFHGLSNELPWGIGKAGCKSIVTIHDLIFLRYPDTYNCLSRQILKAKTQYACRHADKIIAISQRTKQDIVDFYHIPEEKIEVVYQGCDHIFCHKVSADIQQRVRKQYGIPSRYLLSVGTFEPRKNHCSLLQSLALSNDDIHLVLISKHTSYQEVIEKQIVSLKLQKRVHLLNDVPNCDLPAIYQGCNIFLYLSYFEGFGIPVLEAITSGVPVIAASGSSLEEAGGTAARYCDPFDYQQIANSMDELLKSPQQAEPMLEAGKKHIESFSDERIAEHLVSVYRKLLRTN